jgi:DNA-binding transcriptional ArsR family regulator
LPLRNGHGYRDAPQPVAAALAAGDAGRGEGRFSRPDDAPDLDPPPHTVRSLAEKLDVSKPVITRALDTMGAMKLVSRHRDEKDRRNVLIRRTVEGALYVERIGDVIIDKAAELPL